MEEYGSIHAINLLGTKENEASLTSAYARHLQMAHNALGDDLSITHFDFHNAVRLTGHESVIRELRFVFGIRMNLIYHLIIKSLGAWTASLTMLTNLDFLCATPVQMT